jgi:hypothetical protein
MTTQLDELFRAFGFLAAMIRNLDEARERWASDSPDSNQQVNQFSLPAVFGQAYSDGTTRLRQETPEFLYGMCFVHAYGLFEHYLKSILRAVLHEEPRILLTPGKQQNKESDKKVSYREIIDSLGSPTQLLDLIIDRELDSLMYMSCHDQLKAMRGRFGFRELADSLDSRIVHLNKIRNCIVHNHTRADPELARISRKFYKDGRRIHVDRNVVSRAITSYSLFALSVDQIAEQKYHLVPQVVQASPEEGD